MTGVRRFQDRDAGVDTYFYCRCLGGGGNLCDRSWNCRSMANRRLGTWAYYRSNCRSTLGLFAGPKRMFAVLRALQTARERGFTRIRIRSDYNSMRRDLRNRYRSGADGKNELQKKILALARQFEWIDFGYVPRRKNQIAHNLARKGRLMKPVSIAKSHE